MKTLKEYLHEAREKGVAVGHFNISNLEALHAIFNAAKKLNVPIIIGASEGERDFIGIPQVVALVKSFREANNYPIFLNADHTYSFERVKEAIDAGFDSVIYDGAKLPLEENIKITKQCVEYARNYTKETGREVLIEGELGYIGQSSKLLDAVPEGVQMTTVEDAVKYVTETGIDLFAPAVGNIHGMLKNAPEPALNTELVKNIYDAVKIPLVLHGGSGNSVEDFKQSIKNGMACVHINTEIRVAYRDALKKSLEDGANEVAPYKFAAPAVAAVEAVVEEKLKVFNLLA